MMAQIVAETNQSCRCCERNWTNDETLIGYCTICSPNGPNNDTKYYCSECGSGRAHSNKRLYDHDYKDSLIVNGKNQMIKKEKMNGIIVSNVSNVGASVVTGLQAAKQLVISPKSIEAVINALELSDGAAKNLCTALEGGSAVLVGTALRMIVSGYQWYSGTIDGAEFSRQMIKSGVTGCSGWAAGSAVGAAAAYALQTANPWLIGGAAVIGGVGGAWTAGQMIDGIFPSSKDKFLNEALELFSYEKQSMKDKKQFNRDKISQKYRSLTQVHHSDKGGKGQGKVNAYYGALLYECDKRYPPKNA